jgi:hypothetical protein
MTTPEEFEPKKQRLITWKVALGFLFVLVLLVSQFTGSKSGTSSASSSSSSASSSGQRADTGTHMACEHWRINLSNYSVETLAEQTKGAQQVNKYASVSTIPAIVSNARLMTEAFLQQDAESYNTYATAFGEACIAAGE